MNRPNASEVAYSGILRRVFIPFEDWEGLGGPHTFMANLAIWLEEHGAQTSASFAESDLIFFPIRFDLDALHWGRQRGKKAVVRLDGIWYPEKHGEAYRRHNLDVREIYRHLADFVIFQSDYSRQQCFAMFGEIPNSRYAVVLNGADPRIFFPAQQRRWNPARPRFVTTGRFRDAAMLEPIVLALDELSGEMDFELEVVGPVDDALQALLARPYIRHVEALPVRDVADRLRAADVFLYSHLNPPCPNSVVEAVSTGLPIVGFDSGAMRELVPWSSDLLAPVSDAVFQSYEDFDPGRLADSIRAAVADFARYRERALEHAGEYDFDTCAQKYVAHLHDVLEGTESAGERPIRRMFSRPGRLAQKMGRLSGLGPVVRAAAVDLLVGARRTTFLEFLMRVIRERVEALPPSEALRTLFELDRQIYELEGRQAIRYDDGIHTKHRHIRYHDFFVGRVRVSDVVLDLGCGKGELSADVATAASRGSVVGIDRKQDSVTWAREAFGDRANLRFVVGDITDALPDVTFDVIILSNVLEHIEHRVDLLRRLEELFSPREILIRVPLYQRDWRVPLKEELGVEHRLDLEHFIEYTPESFRAEMDAAGLLLVHEEFRWGEIWAAAAPR